MQTLIIFATQKCNIPSMGFSFQSGRKISVEICARQTASIPKKSGTPKLITIGNLIYRKLTSPKEKPTSKALVFTKDMF